MDLDVRYREKLGPGHLALALNGTYYFKYDQSTPGGTSHKIGTMRRHRLATRYQFDRPALTAGRGAALQAVPVGDLDAR